MTACLRKPPIMLALAFAAGLGVLCGWSFALAQEAAAPHHLTPEARARVPAHLF